MWDSLRERTILEPIDEDRWTTGAPDYYEYIARVKWLGDYTWIEVDANGNFFDATKQTSADNDEQS